MQKKDPNGSQMTGVPQIAFGVIVIIVSVLLIVIGGENTAGYGISGALNMPAWLLGLLVIPFGIGFIVLGLRINRRK